ncbi:MAG: hypothetical protein IKY23_13580 [Lachnospiraceae bacterium]|nr:hypothetical protein [Lachnospiraceae bacterium]
MKKTRKAKLNKLGCKSILFLFCLLMCGIFSGCGYSREEKLQMKEYKKQASENAICYVYEKYGIEAKVIETECEKLARFTILDFWPSATGNVLVHMKYDKEEFLVVISGTEQTNAGMDNYQIEEIRQAIKEQATELVGFSIEEIGSIYGGACRGSMKINKNGLVNTYYDGTNLAQILTENGSQTVCSCIDEDLSVIDDEGMKKALGDEEMLFVSYRSKDDYGAVKERNINLGGFPLAYGIEEKSLFIREYRVFGGIDEEYVKFDLREQDGIYYIPKDSDAKITLTAKKMNNASNWNGRGFSNAKQVLDNAYLVESDTEAIYFFVPRALLEESESADEMEKIVYQCYNESGTQYEHAVTWLSDDGKYLFGTIYMRDYSDIRLSVLRDIEVTEKEGQVRAILRGIGQFVFEIFNSIFL